MKPILNLFKNIKMGDKIPIYGAKKIKIMTTSGNVSLQSILFIDSASFNKVESIEFPVINNKSPMYLIVSYVSADNIGIRYIIEEFGGTPSETYFEDGA